VNALAPRAASPEHEWKAIPLGELLLELRNGLVAVQEKELPGIPITRIETISHGVVNLDRVRYVRDVPSEKLKRFWLKKGDLLFSHINSDLHLGKTAVVISEVPLLHGMNLLLLRPDPNRLASKFLHYWLDHCRRVGRFMAIAQHAVNQSSLNQQKISSLEIPLPPLGVQDEIVAEIEKQFSRLDEAVANLKRVKANLKRYKASVLKAAVEGRLVPTEAELSRKEGRTCESGGNLAKHILRTRQSRWNGKGTYKVPSLPDETRLPIAPIGWAWVTVEALAFVTKLAGFEYTKYVKYEERGDLAVIKAENAGPEGFRRTEFSRICSDTVSQLTRSQLKPGDLLMVFVGAGTGRVACVPDDQPYFLGPNISMIRIETAFADSRYLEHYLRSPLGYSLALGLVKAVAQPSLSMGTIRTIPVAMPPLSEQYRIVDEVDRRLSLVRGVEIQVDANLKRAQRLRQAILQTAFEISAVARQ